VDYKDYDKKLYTNAAKRATHDDSEKILFHTLGINYEDAQLMVAPSDILCIYLAKLFIHQYFSSINTGVENILKPFLKHDKEMDREIILDRPTYTATFDEVRQFLIKIAWNLAKTDTTLEKGKYSDKILFAFEKVDGIEKCIGTSAQRNANHHNTPFEAQVMFNASFLKDLTHFGGISNNLIRKSMAPEHVQKSFRVLASKLGRKNFDFTSKKTFFSCWETEEVIDEIILSKSVDQLDKEMGTENQYSILNCNSSASVLVDKDLDNYANFMEEYQKNLLIKVEAGTPARKVVRPIPEEQSTENTAATWMSKPQSKMRDPKRTMMQMKKRKLQ
jgi:hypothetical protein